MVLKKIGQKIARFGDFLQQPYLFNLRLREIDGRMFESLYKPWLLNLGIQTVFDVGANTGQFARVIHEIFPEAFIYSFEPLSDCFRELQKVMQKVKNFQAFNTALADREGEAVFYRSEWSPSSSLRPMEQLHKEHFPFTARECREIVHVQRLDDYTDDLNIQDNVLVKLDVQGGEDRVIAGGKRLLQRTKILIVETSMETLYCGQPLFRDIFRILEGQGFSYKGALSQLISPIDGRVLQADSIYVREA
jgi:FkbM family methyltransferase